MGFGAVGCLPVIFLVTLCICWTNGFNSFRQDPEEALTIQQQVHVIVNQEREANNLIPYYYNQELYDVAQAHAEDMENQNYFSHTGLDGSTFSQRAVAANYDGSPTGENIAQGQGDPESVMTAWMNSAGHRSNILSSSSREIGIGYTPSGKYWVQVFGTRSVACGNGLAELVEDPPEECDDKNQDDTDGCSNTCKINSDYRCTSDYLKPTSECNKGGDGGDDAGIIVVSFFLVLFAVCFVGAVIIGQSLSV